MQYQRQVEEGEVIYQPDPDDDNGYFLEHGFAYLLDDEALISKASKKAACTLKGPVILNAPNLILKVPLGCWAVAGQKSKIYIFSADIFTSRFKTEDSETSINLQKGQFLIFNPDHTGHGTENITDIPRNTFMLVVKRNEWLDNLVGAKNMQFIDIDQVVANQNEVIAA